MNLSQSITDCEESKSFLTEENKRKFEYCEYSNNDTVIINGNPIIIILSFLSTACNSLSIIPLI